MPKDSTQTHSAFALPPVPRYTDFAEFGREIIDAAIDSNAALSAGMEAIGQEVALYAHSAFRAAGETARGLLGARTLEDVVRLQTDFAKVSFESFAERSAKLAELGCSLFGASVGAWVERARAKV